MTVEETLSSLVDRFNRHADHNPATAEELQGIRRTIAVHLTDEGTYAVDLREGRLTNLRTGAPPRPTSRSRPTRRRSGGWSPRRSAP